MFAGYIKQADIGMPAFRCFFIDQLTIFYTLLPLLIRPSNKEITANTIRI